MTLLYEKVAVFAFAHLTLANCQLSMATDGLTAATQPTGDGSTEIVLANTYRLTRSIFTGTFSEVRLGEIISSGVKIAAKLETAPSRLPLLQIEKKIYDLLKGCPGFPRIHYFGKVPGYTVLVMQQLGPNLEAAFNVCKRQFSLKTITYIAIQLITRFEAIHRQGIVYRDVKPENFLLSLDRQDGGLLYVVDFGLSKSFYQSGTRRHIADAPHHGSQQGTVRYLSLNAHRRHEQSRRDDLEALGYVLLYFLKQGKLPWSGLQGLELKERYRRIYEYKYSIPIETLCHGFPVEFANFLRYTRTLEFDQEPDYEYCQTLFVALFQRENFRDDGLYDWTNKIPAG